MTDEGAYAIPFATVGAQPLEPEDPRRIGAFPLSAVLGSGGMGRVYLGLAPTGYTAVKRVLPFLAADRNFLRHFSQELDNQARLPAGVSARLLAADRTARPPWFATEYIPGVTLHESVHVEGGSLPGPALWALLRELADRLRVVHSLSMTHRDLKPSNVMLTHSGVRLIDFGVARAADQSAVTETGVAVGTPASMSPEQARAERTLTSHSTRPSHAAEASSAAATKSSGSSASTGGSGSGGSSGGSSSVTTPAKTASPAGSKPNKVASFDFNYGSCFGACDPYPLVISWNAQSDATSYDIHYQNTTRGIDEVIHSTGTSYTINTTNSGDHVCLQMRAVNPYGDSVWNPTSPACFDMPY